MKQLSQALLPAEERAARASLPERIVQFGEGNFLRGFAGWMVHRMNARGLFSGRIVVVQPLATGNAALLNAQDGLYTVLVRGREGGQVRELRELVQSVSRCVDPYADFEAFLGVARLPHLRFVISNTTEAGIRTDAEDRLDARPARSFPGKLTQLLYARFSHFEGSAEAGLVVLPCELIERNGAALCRAVLDTARAWQLPGAFLSWLSEACAFHDTLVDRIVPGYPRLEAPKLWQELGHEDPLLVAAEAFHFWAIQAPADLEQALPLRRAGVNAVFAEDIEPYRERKVRILNGAHTLAAMLGYLAGHDTVGQCMADPLLRRFLRESIDEEILPTLRLPERERTEFARVVLERFENPFVRHELLSISLNSVSKYRARVLGTLLDRVRQTDRLPERLTLGLAALLAFYRGEGDDAGALVGDRNGERYAIRDEPAVLEFFRDAWRSAEALEHSREACLALSQRALGRADFWGCDLNQIVPPLHRAVGERLHQIRTDGARAVLERGGSSRGR